MKPHLSIIIPAYNEEARILPTLQSCHAYLSAQPYTYDIVVVDDGSTDKTVDVINEVTQTMPHVRVISLTKNLGKGAAVKTGMLHTHGDVRLFMDADNSTRIEEIAKMKPLLSEGYDLVIGSRRIEGAQIVIKQGLFRESTGAVFRGITHTLVPLNIKDTQNGFKLFTAKAADALFPTLHTQGLSFDVEVLLRAQKLGFKIKEVPIIWLNDTQSKVTLPRMAKMLYELILIRVTNK